MAIGAILAQEAVTHTSLAFEKVIEALERRFGSTRSPRGCYPTFGRRAPISDIPERYGDIGDEGELAVFSQRKVRAEEIYTTNTDRFVLLCKIVTSNQPPDSRSS